MGQLCLREVQEQRTKSTRSRRDTGGPSNLIDQAPSKKTLYRFFEDQNFENVANEKKYFYSMFFYSKIQKKILKLSHVSKKRSQEISIQQIQNLCSSLRQYIQYLQTIQEKFQLYDQVYEESEKGYLESDAYSFSIDNSLRNANYSQQNYSNSHGQGNSGFPSNKLILLKNDSHDNNDNADDGHSETLDHNQSTHSTNNCNQMNLKFDGQDVKQNLHRQPSKITNKDQQEQKQLNEDIDKMIIKATNSCDSVLLYDMGHDSDKANSQNNDGLNDQNIQEININKNQDNNNIYNQIQTIQNNSNNDQNTINQKKQNYKNINSKDNQGITQINVQQNIQCSNKQANNSNNEHFINFEREQLQTINEEGIQSNNLFNSSTLNGNSIIQLGDSNMFSQISINDLQNALPQYEVSEIFGRISERLEQPLLIIELHKLLHQSKTIVGSFRISVEVLFKDGGKNQEQQFVTVPLIQKEISTQIYNIPDIDINEVFEFISEINLSERSYTKFKVSIYYTPHEKIKIKEKSEDSKRLQNLQTVNQTTQEQDQKSNKEACCNPESNTENKHLVSQSQNSSQENKNVTQTLPTKSNNDQEENFKCEKTTKQIDEIKLSSQLIDLRNYMDQQIHYLNLKFSNKPTKQNINIEPIIVTVQARFQFVYDQKNLVNNLMSDLNQQKTILEEILTNLNHPNSISNNSR